MGCRINIAVLAGGLACCAHAADPFQVLLTTHNEQPHVPDTPNFTNFTAQADYVRWRNALKDFGEMCVQRGVRYNCQCDWNFLEGVRKWEVNPGTAIPGITANTANLNVLAYLYQLGQTSGVPVEIDPHSHETQGYSYADVAWLIGQCGVSPAPVVGGHVLDDTTRYAEDFDRLSAATGVVATKFAAASNWFPQVLMGGATASHVNDPHNAGVWRPASAAAYFTHDTNGPLTAVGAWQNDLHELGRLIERLETGELPHHDLLWAGALVLNHRDLQAASYRTNEARMILDTLKAWQDAGRIRTATYLETLSLWQTNFGETASLYERPDDNVSFSLNWQDFHYTNESAAYLDAILTLHEQHQVPLDVFFTTWQTDIIEQYPDLMGRLQSSAMVVQGYHVRPPKPYASNFLWGDLTNAATDKAALILDYETHGLNLVTGLPTTHSGGYAKLTDLRGYAPVCVGALAPGSVAADVYGVFSNLGARMFVQHDPPVNLNTDEGTTHLPYRPEHRDWKLIGVWDGHPDDPQPATLTQAIAEAHNTSTNGGRAPWFVGIKLHDNDLFAEQSQWTLVYSNAWSRPWDPTQYSASLPEEDETNRFAFYAALVAEADARRTNLNLLNSHDTIALMGDARTRPIGLSHTAFAEHPLSGAELAVLRGGGGVAGQALRYRLVAGDGDDDNGDFFISSNRLLAAGTFDYETQPARHLRVRWEWIDGLDGASVLAAGERALTVVLLNVDTDDDDGDGMTEAEEDLAGTDPLDPDSVLEVLSALASTDGSVLQLSVLGVTGRLYSIESSTNLVTWMRETGDAATHVPGPGTTLSLTDTNALALLKFYRVATER
jgi:hypothetical protein